VSKEKVMIVEIKVFSFLRKGILTDERHLDGDRWDIGERATVGQVLEMLNLRGRGDLILLVNGNHAHSESVLSEGDVLSILPPIGGG
jgi:molybdopterin converting factor small subunit